ncbi:MAG: DUF3267 domain-containing protein [Bacteroidales bacterium]|nr:DUF3267 domain-containing protein [Bacteroidales bacterium]
MKRPDVDTLQKDPRYRKILELDFNEMIPFVLNNIRGREKIPVLFMALNLATLVFIVLYVVWGLTGDHFNGGKVIRQLVAGVLAGSILIIPPHEILHGLAYCLLGARHIRFGADFQQFIFFVTADRFPISRNELRFLAMTPFIVINAVTIALTATWFTEATLFSAALLLSHNIMCIGDFAIISYTNKYTGELYTYDEIEKKKSYFFENTAGS